MIRRQTIQLAAMMLLLSAMLAAGTKPYWPSWPALQLEPIVVPQNALMLGDAWPADTDMCFWFDDFCLGASVPGQPMPAPQWSGLQTREYR